MKAITNLFGLTQNELHEYYVDKQTIIATRTKWYEIQYSQAQGLFYVIELNFRTSDFCKKGRFFTLTPKMANTMLGKEIFYE